MIGELAILNVAAGDTKLTFDPSKPEERRRAAAVVTDMLKRGFAILVQVGEKDGKPLYQRAESFDPETCEYIIVGMPEGDTGSEEAEAEAPQEKAPAARRGRPRKESLPRHRIKAESTKAVSVARSAGG